MKYKALFTISFFHEYFHSGSASGTRTPELDQYLTLVPSDECAQMIKGYRLILRNKPGQLLLLSPEHSKGTFLPKKELTFRFFLKIKNPSFLQLTDLGAPPLNTLEEVFAGIRFPYYFADGAQEDLPLGVYEEYKAVDQFQIREEKSSEDTFFLKNVPLSGLGRDDFSIQGLKNNSFRPVKYDSDLKTIHFSTNSYLTGQPFWVSYRAIPPWASSTFGLVDVKINGANPAFEKKYRIAFNSRESHWNYLIICPDTLKSTDLKIENGTNDANPLLFDQAAEITGGAEFDQLKSVFSKAKIFKISSTNEISFNHKVKTNIKLKKKNEVIIPHLPNPSPEKNGTAIINIYS